MDAADVLPEWTTSVATLACGAPILPAIDMPGSARPDRVARGAERVTEPGAGGI